jgi:hypothetical protein
LAKKTNKKIQEKKTSSIDVITYIEKYFWVIIPILTIVYFYFSKISPGFYQDDEIAHFVNAKKFWIDPSIILGNWPKPGYKIFLVIPSLFGYNGVIFFNSFISAVTVFLTYKVIKLYKVEYAFFGALILAFQPLFVDLSFRSYAEIFTALLFLLLILTYKKENYFLTGLICGYIFTVRQETIILSAILIIIFIIRKKYFPVLSFFIFPLIYSLIGYFVKGDIMYVFSQMTEVGNIDVGGARRGYFHYFKVLIYIISPVTLGVFLNGFFGFFIDTKKIKEYLVKFDILYAIIIITFIAQIAAMQKGVNPGSWRYILHIAPIMAVFANIGLVNLIKNKTNKFNWVILIVYIILVLSFWSKTTNGLDLLDENSYLNLLFASLVFITYLLIFKQDIQKSFILFSTILIILNIIFLITFFKPRKLSDANVVMKQVAEFVSNSEYKNKIIYTTHSNFDFYGSEIGLDFRKIRSFNLDTLKVMAKDDIVIWDSFYSYRPEYKWNVQLEVLYKDTVQYKLIQKFNSANNKFAAVMFQKIK